MDTNNTIVTKTVTVGEVPFRVQYNAARVRSSAAKTDAASIAQRPCFLCKEHRPPTQKSVDWKGRYEILQNPFPIFPQHLTIPTYEHTPQDIRGRWGDMLALAAEMPDFTVFFNGPKCGASAPDHMHFQAGSRHFMPIEQQWQEQIGEHLAVVGRARLHLMEHDPRHALVIVAEEAADAVALAERVMEMLEATTPPSLRATSPMTGEELKEDTPGTTTTPPSLRSPIASYSGAIAPQAWEELKYPYLGEQRKGKQTKEEQITGEELKKALPLDKGEYGEAGRGYAMVNVLCYYENGQWVTFILPRTKHRPQCYFAEGEEQMIISPASVDLGGVFITVRPEDYERLDSTRLADILREVCWQATEIELFKWIMDN